MIIDITKKIPDDNVFHSIINSFVFHCPSAMVTSKKKAKVKTYESVSVRECAFRSKGITGTLLTTITAQIKRTVKSGFYHKIENSETVEDVFDKDTSKEKIVFLGNSQMSDAEVVFYYIRNAFAHGDFEVLPGTERVYKLESKKKNTIKAKMILEESTVLKLAKLAAVSKSQVEKLQKKRAK